jgi:hypothetical protein
MQPCAYLIRGTWTDAQKSIRLASSQLVPGGVSMRISIEQHPVSNNRHEALNPAKLPSYPAMPFGGENVIENQWHTGLAARPSLC